MLKIILLISPMLMVGCNSSSSLPVEQKFTNADSLQIVNVIIDSLYAEMNTQWFMKPTDEKIRCYEPPSFSPRLLTEINTQNQVMINGVINPKSISKSVVKFYSDNLYKNDVTNNSPFYTELSQNALITQIRALEEELETIKSRNDASQEIARFKQIAIDEWKKKLEILDLLGGNCLREPQHGAGIEIRYYQDSKIYQEVLDSLLMGIYKIREIDSKIYFNESYAKIFWKACKQKDSIALKKLNAFKILHPVHILDYNKSRYSPKIEVVPPSSGK